MEGSVKALLFYLKGREERIQMEDCMLSTIDNPFNPFDEFDKWYNFDVLHGYNSCSYLAKVSKTSDELPENLTQIDLERAIDEIVELNINGMFCKVTRKTEL